MQRFNEFVSPVLYLLRLISFFFCLFVLKLLLFLGKKRTRFALMRIILENCFTPAWLLIVYQLLSCSHLYCQYEYCAFALCKTERNNVARRSTNGDRFLLLSQPEFRRVYERSKINVITASPKLFLASFSLIWYAFSFSFETTLAIAPLRKRSLKEKKRRCRKVERVKINNERCMFVALRVGLN